VSREVLLAASLVVATTFQAQTSQQTSSGGVPGKFASMTVAHSRVSAVRSVFRAELRGDLATSASGEAEFGAVRTADRSSAAFVVSLGVCGQSSAILFTRTSGTPVGVGRYRISDRPNRAGEILALVMTGRLTRPSGVFRGQSGWLVVTAASDRLITGQFQLDGVGLLTPQYRREDRHVTVTGSFSAIAGSSSSRVCKDAQ
jgi:hypothetical protein